MGMPCGEPPKKDCIHCSAGIGVASQYGKHCNGKQPRKVKLQKAKEKIIAVWADSQKKNGKLSGQDIPLSTPCCPKTERAEEKALLCQCGLKWKNSWEAEDNI
ncbi:hypothetical protein SKAU_G00020850 [Synaphobranchus kaupii]|uniref:Uncharacterized protein n=1 Tax=Synaphobranchus kaupii TaxID=118154 RepID=A0A9Q1GC90_SYNKA|nr:hypothetical protein SKAU_G00020850 [Synaphobranchus kaupii]